MVLDKRVCKYDTPEVVYHSNSPLNLLGIPFLSKYFAKDNPHEMFDYGTLILTRANNSHFHGTMASMKDISNTGKLYFRNYDSVRKPLILKPFTQ